MARVTLTTPAQSLNGRGDQMLNGLNFGSQKVSVVTEKQMVLLLAVRWHHLSFHYNSVFDKNHGKEIIQTKKLTIFNNAKAFLYAVTLVTGSSKMSLNWVNCPLACSLNCLSIASVWFLIFDTSWSTCFPSDNNCVNPLCRSSFPYRPRPMAAQHSTETMAKVTFMAAIEREGRGLRSQHRVSK